MALVTPIATNFTAGEFSPQLDGRVDVARYFNAVQRIENFIVAPFGGADRRPGSVFVAPAKFSDKKCRLIPFQFSTVQAYIIEMGELYMRFYRDDAAITEASKAITGATQADPVNLTIVTHGYSVGDEIIVNGVVGMTELNGKRFRVDTVPGASNITIEDLDGVTVDGTGFTAYISGGVANKIVEIVTPYLESELFDIQFAQTADIMFIVHRDQPIQKLTRTSDTVWILTQVDTIGGPFQATNLIVTDTVTPSATTGTGITVTANTPRFNTGQVGGLLRMGGLVSGVQGFVKITVFGTSTSVTADVIKTLSGTGPFDDWAFGSFSVDAGFPQTVGFHEQRLFFGGTTFEPQTIFGSQTLIFDNFTPGALDTDALQYEIATEQVNRIRWISTGRGLGIGTSGGAFVLSTGTEFVPLTPTNTSVRRETTFGAELILPKRIGNFLYYIQRGSRTVREYAFNFDIDAHRSLDMTLLSEQITESGIVVMDFQQSPNSVLWCVRNDGEIATMTRQQDQEVIAWTRQITAVTIGGAGSYESVAAIPKGEEDEVWVSVKRIVNSVTRRFVEFYSPADFGVQNDAFFVDSGLSFSGPSTTILTGLDHLEGESVQILNEGAVEPNKTVINGAVTLEEATTRAHVGLGYISVIQSLKLESGSQISTIQGKIARVHEVTFRFFKTLGAQFGREDQLDQIVFRKISDLMDTAVPLFTGDKRQTFPKGYTREPRVFLQQEQPLPMSVLAIIPRFDVQDQ